MVRPDNFSRAGLIALFDYIGELEREMAWESELDPIAICSDWSEYRDAIEAAEAYGWKAPEIPDGEDKQDTSERDALQFLEDNAGDFIEFEGGIIVLNF